MSADAAMRLHLAENRHLVWRDLLERDPGRVSLVCDNIVRSRLVPNRLLARLSITLVVDEYLIEREAGRMEAEVLITPYQARILEQLAGGKRSRAISKDLGVSEDAIKTQMLFARRALGARNTTHAVAISLRAGYIQYPQPQRRVA